MRKKLLLVATFLLAFMIFLVPIRAVESERCIIKIHLEDLQIQSSDMNGVKFYVYIRLEKLTRTEMQKSILNMDMKHIHKMLTN